VSGAIRRLENVTQVDSISKWYYLSERMFLQVYSVNNVDASAYIAEEPLGRKITICNLKIPSVSKVISETASRESH
jgi:hypothetical protein